MLSTLSTVLLHPMNTLAHLALVSLLPLALMGCVPKPVGSETTTQRFEVISVYATKQSRATLRHVETGRVFEGVRTGRRCYSMRQNVPVGSQWDLPYTTTRYEDGTSRVSVNAGSLCHVRRG